MLLYWDYYKQAMTLVDQFFKLRMFRLITWRPLPIVYSLKANVKIEPTGHVWITIMVVIRERWIWEQTNMQTTRTHMQTHPHTQKNKNKSWIEQSKHFNKSNNHLLAPLKITLLSLINHNTLLYFARKKTS